MNYRRVVKFFIPALLLFLAGCATDKDAWLNINYNSITTRFNGYFNGKESLKEGVAQIQSRHVDDYNMVLPVFRYGDQTIASSANSYMDVAIRKASVQIQKRTMFIRGQEKNRWIDDCWLLIGKAHFYKMEYEMAMQNFDFIIARYRDKPSRYHAMLWKVRTNNQLKRFNDNEALLGLLQKNINSREVPRSVKKMYPLVRADFFIQQGNYEGAIVPLKNAIRLNRNKDVRARSTYILAQIYHQLDRCEEASKLYKKVVQLNPEYEMAFNAKINMARCFKLAKADGRTIKRYLNKMVRDEKNQEYLDQVYFALAEVYMKEKNDTLAMKNLRLSVAHSTTNLNQKAISSLMLADLYFKYENYPGAQAYYDSAVTYLQRDFPNYDVLMKKHDILSRLVNNIMVVHTQDSLQRLAKMPANERMRIVNGIIAEINRKEQEAKEQESQQFQNFGFLEMEMRNMQRQQQQTSEWYFDNPASRSFGYSEFKNKWGERKLEDMWRLSSRRGDGGLMTEEELKLDSIRQDSIKAVTAQLKDPEYYLKNIPLTPEAIDASNLKIEKALYNMGYIYFYDLSDVDKSIESFEKQMKRFPTGQMIPPACYQLYQVYTRLGFQDKAAAMKRQLLQEHPEHEYAMILSDPDYFANRAKELDKHRAMYAQTFSLYEQGKYADAKIKSDSALNNQSYSEAHPRFSLLNAMIVGNLDGKAAYVKALETTASKFGKTPEGIYASNLLNLLREDTVKKTATTEPDTDKKIDYSIYNFSATKNHLVLLIVDTKFGKVENVKNSVSDFNRKSFSSKNLNVTTTVLSANIQMITVSSFPNAREAMIYHDALKDDKVFAGRDAEGQSAVFAISGDNYPIFFKDRDVDKYMAFFRDHYFK